MLRHCGFYEATGKIFGLEHVKEFDLSYNDLHIWSPDMAANMAAVKSLVLSHTNQNASHDTPTQNRTITNTNTAHTHRERHDT